VEITHVSVTSEETTNKILVQMTPEELRAAIKERARQAIRSATDEIFQIVSGYNETANATTFEVVLMTCLATESDEPNGKYWRKVANVLRKLARDGAINNLRDETQPRDLVGRWWRKG
jgi:hypothetical protein